MPFSPPANPGRRNSRDPNALRPLRCLWDPMGFGLSSVTIEAGHTRVLCSVCLEEELPRWQGARVLDCPGGPGSLAARLRPCGIDVTAVDPLYALGDEALEQRALADLERTLATLAASDDLRPDFDLQACRRQHMAALQAFLADRRARPDRYIAASLPDLPFPARAFDLVLSGHLLFSYAPRRDGGLMVGDGLDLAWHRRALAELCRVSALEVRLYPAHTIERDARHRRIPHHLLEARH
jgi:hypothetical protein